jgi:hypothetical protein
MQVLVVVDVWAAMTDIHPNLWKAGRTTEDYPWAKVSRWRLFATVALMNLGAAASRKQYEGREGERRRIR